MVSNNAEIRGIINMEGGRYRAHLDFDYLGNGDFMLKKKKTNCENTELREMRHDF